MTMNELIPLLFAGFVGICLGLIPIIAFHVYRASKMLDKIYDRIRITESNLNTLYSIQRELFKSVEKNKCIHIKKAELKDWFKDNAEKEKIMAEQERRLKEAKYDLAVGLNNTKIGDWK